MSKKPAPIPNPDSKAFWDTVNQERLTLQHCLACGVKQYIPRVICKNCSSDDLETVEARPFGSIHTFTVQHRAPTPAFKDDIPFIIALIDLDDGPRIMANVINVDHEKISIGLPVRIIFEQRGSQKLPQAEVII